MARSIFGWDLPAGVTTKMLNDQFGDDGISPLVEAVLTLLEEAGIPSETNDKIAELIEQAEAAMPSDPELPR